MINITNQLVYLFLLHLIFNNYLFALFSYNLYKLQNYIIYMGNTNNNTVDR